MRFLLALLLYGCASVPFVAAPVATPLLVHGGGGSDVDALVEAYYGEGLPPERAVAMATEVLRKHPGCARAHEIAAAASSLLGDRDAFWRHTLYAAADLDGDATELHLWQLGGEPASQARVSDALLEALRLHHPRAEARALAAATLAAHAEYRGRHAEAEGLVGPLGFIREWQVLGALDNDQGKGFLTAYPPEQRVELGAAVPGPLVPVRWRRVERLTHQGSVPLGQLLWPNEFGVAYLVTWAHSDRERSAQLRIESSSPTRAFVNDGLVLSEEQVEESELDNLVAPVTLHAGYNQILVKSAHRRGGWSLRAAPVVIERGYGDCKDKAVLLIQMARRVGLALHFAILRTTPFGRVAREVPNQQRAIARTSASRSSSRSTWMARAWSAPRTITSA